uniref:Dolichyl-diphosphooligosaccharide--protein glycosyltransferase 48 kDa subunit n=1 Tax=Araucaria cunninghamii TaxID=56994 RepID=A0A0D6QZT8_ARACU
MAVLRLIAALLMLSPILSLAFSPENPTNQRILVLLDDLAIKSSHSIFFKSLTDRGYNLDFKLADDPKLSLQRYGQYLYDGLIIFAPSAERLGGALDLPAVLDFVDSGHDLILAADTTTSDLIRDIAAECGVDFDEDPEALVIDHTSYAISKTDTGHTLIVSDNVIDSKVILGEKKLEAPVLFQGIAHSLNPANSLVLKVLSASPSAYSANPKAEISNPPALIGSSISLVSVVQGRNNARIVISGSLDLFSNKFMKSAVKTFGSSVEHGKSGNEQFVSELSKWVFHERGHLKAVNVQHHKIGETVEPATYRITDYLEYSVEIFEWTGKDWKPYVADDVQVQFYMMSPYVLKTLSHNNKGLYSTSFQVPDVYGVFQFKIEYRRLGYTSLSLSKQIPVRPFRHNEYERFIISAYPYYGGAFSMMAGFFIFGLVFLYHK